MICEGIIGGEVIGPRPFSVKEGVKIYSVNYCEFCAVNF